MLLGGVLSALIVLFALGVYAKIIWWADRYEKEPRQLFAAAIFLGAIPATLVSLLLEVQVHLPATFWGKFVDSSVVGPSIEEGIKGSMLVLICWLGFMEFDGVLDGLVYAALIGFGFGMTENFLYFLHALRTHGWATWLSLVILRQGLFGLNHAFYTAFTGVGCGLARDRMSSPRAWIYPVLGYMAAVFTHALHNGTLSFATHAAGWFLLTLLFDAMGVVLVVFILMLAITRQKRLIQQELAEEVGRTFSDAEYQLILAAMGIRSHVDVSRPKVWAHRRRLRQLAAELALKKRQLRAGEDSRELRLRIAQLRAQIVTLFRSTDT